MAGRPRLFDETDALRSAMGAFWKNGFSGASMADIEEATGVGRQSLYNAIGSKEIIFTRALELYADEEMKPLFAALHGPGTPIERLRTALRASRASVTEGECRGCLMVQTISEVGDSDGPLGAMMRTRIQMFEGAFLSVVDEARRAGELPADTNTTALTRLIMASNAGMAMLARAGVPDAFLDDLLEGMLTYLAPSA